VERFMSCSHNTISTFLDYFFLQNGLIKSCSSSNYISAREVSCPHVVGASFCIHLRSLNVRYSGVVEDMGFEKYGVEATFSAMTSVLTYIKHASCFKSH